MSGRTEQALRDQAARLLTHLQNSPTHSDLDIAHSLATSRTAHEHRAALTDTDRHAGLHALITGTTHPHVIRGTQTEGRTAFLFTGQGSQYPGMGMDLYTTFPTFAQAFDDIAAHLDPLLDQPLHETITTGKNLDNTGHTQPALFAIEVALFRLLESLGTRPDFMAGHSIGEIAAAHTAGILTLPDAATLVAARATLMQQLPPDGAMHAIQTTEAEITTHLQEHEDRLSIAAVNGPRSVVIAGDAERAQQVAEALRDQGRRTTRLTVSHAFHSPHMEPMLDAFLTVLADLSFHEPRIPVVSTVTGEVLTRDQWSSPAYWARQVREPVRFFDAVRTLETAGVTTFLEVGPDGVCAAMAADSLREADGVATVAAQRKGRPQAQSLVAALGTAFVRGTAVDWRAFFEGTGARRVPLPTYAFQHERYWLEQAAPTGAAGGPTAASGHPLLGLPVFVAESDEVLFTSRISPRTHPSLARHTMLGSVVLSAPALVEFALYTGDETGDVVLDELHLRAPLVLSEDGAAWLQVRSGVQDGRRTLSVHSSPDSGTGDRPGASWTLHAEGSFRSDDAAMRGAPPEGGTTVDLRLPDESAEEAARYGIHPDLLGDALPVRLFDVQGDTVPVPADWYGVRLYATGATGVRAQVTELDERTIALRLTDANGELVATVDSIVYRDVPAGEFRSARSDGGDALLTVEWGPAAEPSSEVEPLRWGVLGTASSRTVTADGDPSAERFADVGAAAAAAARIDAVVLPWDGADTAEMTGSVRGAAREALAVLQRWFAEDRLAGVPLVILTRGAVVISDAEIPALAEAALWGFVRSAQSEAPGRIILLDTDGELSAERLSAVLASGEQETALRGDRVLLPRLRRVPAPVRPPAAPSWNAAGTVLVTGGTGMPGAAVVRHLVQEHGVAHLLLTRHDGADPQEEQELVAELAGLGADVTVVTCDVADRAALELLLRGIPSDRPLTGVVHTVEALDNGLVGTLTPERLEAVMRPKSDGAWNLHEATRHQDLTAFVMFSSTVGVFGGPGAANYAAANAFLDGLAHYRRAAGLPATSIAWGLWESDDAAQDAKAYAGFVRSGFRPMTRAQGTTFFDRALASGATVPVATSLSTLAPGTEEWMPPLLRTLSPRRPTRRQASSAVTEPSPAEHLAPLTPVDRERWVLSLVREEVAAVLGHATAGTVSTDRSFQELGFDSMTGVELRNRLGAATGVALPATLVFDHPTPAALADSLLKRLVPDTVAESHAALSELDKLEALLSRTTPQEAAERDELTTRLQALVAKLNASATALPDASDVIESASADELFSFIDSQLGRSVR
ncbi:SDR family NAD(P)-dependent oxidoreductase [Streptomyces sp. SID3212]|nr:SDR family NAD(P)-dependent oxidoreductase [Streptomyces sp. SID3212]